MIKKEISEKLFKTKLSEQQRVELAIVNDLKTSAKSLTEDMGNLIDQKRRFENEVKRLKQSFDNHNKIFRKASNMADELGVELDNFYYRQIEDVESVLKQYSKLQ